MNSIFFIESIVFGVFFAFSLMIFLSEWKNIRKIFSKECLDARENKTYMTYSVFFVILASLFAVMTEAPFDCNILSYYLLFICLFFSIFFAVIRGLSKRGIKKVDRIVNDLAYRDGKTFFKLDSYIVSIANVLFFSYYEIDLKSETKTVRFKELPKQIESPYSYEKIAIIIAQEINKFDSDKRLFDKFIDGKYKPNL